ncbi:MAG: hypothetical protein LBH61_03155, partial [Dysgonamonadaceae bacterium]|nr:hypothetical protein [Dysgonamonadaceae bacterium]
MKIQTVKLSHARNEAHYQFFIDYRNLLGVYPEITTIITALMPEFSELLNTEKLLIDNVRGSDYTEEIAA